MLHTHTITLTSSLLESHSSFILYRNVCYQNRTIQEQCCFRNLFLPYKEALRSSANIFTLIIFTSILDTVFGYWPTVLHFKEISLQTLKVLRMYFVCDLRFKLHDSTGSWVHDFQAYGIHEETPITPQSVAGVLVLKPSLIIT